jgi:hypothetical protein
MVKLASKPAGAAGSGYAPSFHAGESIFREGEAGGSLFIIEYGQVELVSGNNHRRLAVLEAGDVFGEISTLEDRPRELGARAVSDVKALKVERGALEPLLRESPDVAILLLRRLARRLYEARMGVTPEARAAAAPPPAAPSAEAAVPSGKLVHDSSGAEFVVPPDARVVVGRAAKGHVPDIDLAPVDGERSLSRRHAAVWREGSAYFVCEENGVANGTFVNGKRLKPGEPVPLAEGDKVAFGLVKTTFHLT